MSGSICKIEPDTQVKGMVVKNSDTICAILPTQWHVCLQGTTVRFNMQYPEGANRS